MDKIRISGTPEQFNQGELDKRQQQYRHAYQSTSQSCETIRGAHSNQLLQAVIDKAALGFTLTDYPASLEPMNYSVQMRKPESLQEADLIKISNDVKDAYKAELQASHENYKERLYAQLVQAEEAKQAAKAQAAKDKMYADLKKQAEDCYAPLLFPED